MLIILPILSIIHQIKHKHDNKKCKTCEIKYKNCVYILEYSNFKDDFTEYKRLYCNKNYQKKFEESLKKGFLINKIFLAMIEVYFIVA